MILLDTHVLLWWQAGSPRLSRAARRAIEEARTVMLSPISFWEIGVLEGKGRIALDRDPATWVIDLMRDDRLSSATLSPSAAMFAGSLPGLGFEGDPADAMIYATSMQERAPLVTKDARLRLFARGRKEVRTIW